MASASVTGFVGNAITQDFLPGKSTAIQTCAVLPKDFLNKDLVYEATFTVDVLFSSGTLKTHLGILPLGCEEGELVTASMTYQTNTDTASPPNGGPGFGIGAGEVVCLRYIIPKALVEEDDFMILQFWRSKDDTFTGKLRLLKQRL